MYKNFIQAITWNSINIFLYKVILLAHQITLFYFVPKELYGTSGSVFSSIYLLIGLTSFGFEYTLFPFFAEYKKSKEHFKKLVPQYIFRITSILIISLAIWITVYFNYNNPIISFFLRYIPQSLLCYLLLVFISESIKKSLDILAQLAFLNKKIAVIQISSIILYVTLLWSIYFNTGIITLHTIFIPMVLTSYFEIGLLLAIIGQFYYSLPSNSVNNQCLTNPSKPCKIFSEQTFNYVNQFSKSLFSPNFLMIFIAYNLGMAQAGYIRFFTNIITLLYMLFNRSIGVPSGALFANITQEPFDKIKYYFLKITNTYIQLLYVLAIIIISTILPQLSKKSIAPHVLFFIAIGFVEYITLTYEKLFIVQKQSKPLAFINIMSIGLLGVFLCNIFHFSGTYLLLLPIFLTRLLSAFIIGLMAYFKWKLLPKLSINKNTVFISLVFILFLYGIKQTIDFHKGFFL